MLQMWEYYIEPDGY